MKKKTLLIDSYPSLGGIARLQNLVPTCLDSFERISYVSSQKVLERAYNLLRLYLSSKVRLKHCSYVLYMHPYLARLHQYLSTNVPYGVLVHGYEIFKDDEGKLNGVFKNADTVICNSQYVHRFIANKYTTNRLVQVYYPTIELGTQIAKKKRDSNSAKAGKEIDPDKSCILTVGRMSKYECYKGHDEIIEALPSILDKFPNTKLIFAGTGDDEWRLRDQVSKKHLDDHIEFKGEISDEVLADLYDLADIFLMPSSGEGQGLVYLEAMQFRTPIIALKDSPAKEFIEHNETGKLISEKTPEEIAGAVCEMLDDKSQIKQFGEKAHKRYMGMDITNNFCRTLRKLIDSSKLNK